MRRHAVRSGVAVGEVKDDPGHRSDDMGAQLEQAVAQPRHLGASAAGAGRAEPQLLHQHIGRDGLTIHVLPGVGHGPHTQAPESFTPSIMEWLESGR